jgi:hypothetical protein
VSRDEYFLKVLKNRNSAFLGYCFSITFLNIRKSSIMDVWWDKNKCKWSIFNISIILRWLSISGIMYSWVASQSLRVTSESSKPMANNSLRLSLCRLIFFSLLG